MNIKKELSKNINDLIKDYNKNKKQENYDIALNLFEEIETQGQIFVEKIIEQKILKSNEKYLELKKTLLKIRNNVKDIINLITKNQTLSKKNNIEILTKTLSDNILTYKELIINFKKEYPNLISSELDYLELIVDRIDYYILKDYNEDEDSCFSNCEDYDFEVNIIDSLKEIIKKNSVNKKKTIKNNIK